jgi:peptidoglycan-associated lipoprotein
MIKTFRTLLILCSLILLVGCSKNGTWEDMKTAGRYLNRGIDHLCGKPYDSKLIEKEEDFYGPNNGDFIPLNDHDLKGKISSADLAVAQPKFSPGENGVPTMDAFQSPSKELSEIFKTIHFETDEHVVRNHEDLLSINKIAAYLKEHANTYICISGHCDERQSAAYNMALGTRRANHIRVLLVKQGVDYNRIYTISYGKEKPIALGHSQDDWLQNRRAEFKVVEK